MHKNEGTVMSDTNAEIKDFIPYVRKMSGRILITGLGIGCSWPVRRPSTV